MLLQYFPFRSIKNLKQVTQRFVFCIVLRKYHIVYFHGALKRLFKKSSKLSILHMHIKTQHKCKCQFADSPPYLMDAGCYIILTNTILFLTTNKKKICIISMLLYIINEHALFNLSKLFPSWIVEAVQEKPSCLVETCIRRKCTSLSQGKELRTSPSITIEMTKKQNS